jgi:hypothetical protein
MFEAPGVPRRGWAPLVRGLGELGREQMARRWEQARRLIHENGVTYNVYGDPRGTDRPWELDLLPLLLPRDEWRALEIGLTQRAQLLNLVLADLYGPQRLLRALRVVGGAQDPVAGRDLLGGLGDGGVGALEVGQVAAGDDALGDAHQRPTLPVRLMSVSSISSIVDMAREDAW